jgi:hypothetical protein
VITSRTVQAAQVADRLLDPLLVLDQREPDEALTAGSEPDARRERDIGVPHDQRTELDRVHLGVGLRDRRPDEHRATGLRNVPPDPVEAVDQCITP